MHLRRPASYAFAAACTLTFVAGAQTQSTGQGQNQGQSQTQAPPPRPNPFPGAIVPTGGKPVEANAQTSKPAAPQAPSVTELGKAAIYPSAEFLDSFDAGQGQKILLYGTNMPYDQIVTFYRAQRLSNRELFSDPPMHQFDLGRYDERVMAYPPSVVVKDYTWNGSEGYLHVSGTTSKRYRTIIQIVPVLPADGR